MPPVSDNNAGGSVLSSPFLFPLSPLLSCCIWCGSKMANPPPSAGLNQDPKFLQALEKARMVAEKIKRETAEKMGGVGDNNAIPSTGLIPPSLGLPPPNQGLKRPAESGKCQ